MILTDRFVMLNFPRTGSTFVRSVLRQLHQPRWSALGVNLTPRASTPFQELTLPIDRSRKAERLGRKSQHGRRSSRSWAMPHISRGPRRAYAPRNPADAMGYLIIESEDEVRLMFDGIVESGHLRLPTAQQTDEFLALAAGKAGGAVVDFQRQRCMSDRTSAWLIWLCVASRGRAITLRMANLCAEDRKLLELFKVDRVIRIDDDDDEPPLGVVAL